MFDVIIDQRSVVLSINGVGKHSIDHQLDLPNNFPRISWEKNSTMTVQFNQEEMVLTKIKLFR
jgi:hypothetical protein